MTYASINEAWGGLSGSSMTTIPMTDQTHPAHRRRQQRARQQQRPPPYKTENDLYQCHYGDENCNQIVNRNNHFNQQQKQVAMGYPPHMNFPGLYPSPYAYLPQYPWYPDAKYNYLNYGPAISHAFYSSPEQYFPNIAHQIQQYQQNHPNQPLTPIGPYQPQGFFPGIYYNPPYPPQYFQQPPPPQQQYPKRKIEKFTMYDKEDYIKKSCMIFMFFLIALAVILCIFMIGFVYYNKPA